MRDLNDQLFVHSFTHTSMGKALLSFDGKWLKVNTNLCESLGYSEEELLQQDYYSVIHMEEVESFRMELKKLYEGERSSFKSHYQFLHKNGQVVTFDQFTSFLRGESLENSAILIELLKNDGERDDKLIHLASLGKMAGSIAHEINNPLSVLSGYSSLLRGQVQKESIDKEKIIELSETIHEGAQRIAKIVSALRNLTKDRDHRSFIEFDLSASLEEALSLCEGKFKHDEIEVYLNPTIQETRVFGDPTLFGRVTGPKFYYHYQDYNHIASLSQSGATVSGTGAL